MRSFDHRLVGNVMIVKWTIKSNPTLWFSLRHSSLPVLLRLLAMQLTAAEQQLFTCTASTRTLSHTTHNYARGAKGNKHTPNNR